MEDETERPGEHDLKALLALEPSGPSSTSIGAAVEALATAIDNMPEGESPKDRIVAGFWRQSGRFQINRWTTDLGRTLHGVVLAVAAVKSNPVPPTSVNELENALWRLDSAREKTKTIASLVLGVPVLAIAKSGKSPEFEVDGKMLGARLAHLAGTYPEAAQLNQVLVLLKDHEAINRRNEISHELAQVAEVPPLSYFQRLDMRGDLIVRSQSMSLHSNWTPFLAGDISGTAVLKQTLGAAVEALELQLTAIQLLTDLVRSAAKLEPWPRVFVDLDTGATSMDDPRA